MKKIKKQLMRIEQGALLFSAIRHWTMTGNPAQCGRRRSVGGGTRDTTRATLPTAERPTWDASSIYCAAATLSPGGVGAFQQVD